MSRKRPLVAVIEDDRDILDLIVYNLERDGFDVAAFRDGAAGLAGVRGRGPDAVVLDLMLPGMDGLELCRTMRAEPQTAGIPVLIVTAKGEESDVVLGLGLGADDYLVKPFRPRELVARVKALLRRERSLLAPAGRTRIEVASIVIDAERHRVSVNGADVEFTATEFRLLHFLAAHPGIVYSRDQIIANVIGDGAIVIDRNIDVHVRALRRKLGSSAELIETVRGVGYRFHDHEA